MKDIDFINRDVEAGFLIVRESDGETVDIAAEIRACDHQLELVSGCPRDIVGCEKCGWWSFAYPSVMRELSRYGIKNVL